MDNSYLAVGFNDMMPLLEACNKAWQAGWDPATVLVIDETMVAWSGASTGHLTFLPRKPTPLGFMLKTLVCGESCIMVHMELCEGKEIDRKKKYTTEFGATTGTTLRLLEPYFYEGRIVIGDAWFGSFKTAVQLKIHGTDCVMNVKLAKAKFPLA